MTTDNLPPINTQALTDFLVRLLNTPSPTGMAEPAIALIEQELSQFKQLTLRARAKARWSLTGTRATIFHP